jgi:hypothetical protein
MDRIGHMFTVGDGCWEWSAAKQSGGYGQVRIHDAALYAHRLVYELLRGPIPDGLQLDHLCRNRGCVRPDHLEVVTRKENIRRGSGFAGMNARKTHCPSGHLLAGDNLDPSERRGRGCLACRREQQRVSGRRRRCKFPGCEIKTWAWCAKHRRMLEAGEL